MNLANRQTVCTPKKLGGLGVMDLQTFNQTMLAKWYWQWLTPEKRVWKSIFQSTVKIARMPPASKFFDKVLQQVYSFCDASILTIPGNGESISFWDQDWGMGILKVQMSNLYSHAQQQHISLKRVTGLNHIRILFRHNLSSRAISELEQLQQQLHTTIRLTQDPDRVWWKWNQTGIFSVKSAYFAMKNGPRIKNDVRKVWKLRAQPRMKIFAWLMTLNRIFTIDNLQKRGWCLVSRCVLCVASETVNHLFSHCTYTMQVYTTINRAQGTNIPGGHIDTAQALLQTIFSHEDKSVMLIAQFVIWRERCSIIFTEKAKRMEDIIEEILLQIRYTRLTGH